MHEPQRQPFTVTPGRRWAQLADTGGLALVRRHRVAAPASGWRQELVRTVANNAFGGWVDSFLAERVRGAGLSYSPESRIIEREGGTLVVIDVPVAVGHEAEADTAIGESLARLAAELDAPAALRRAAGRVGIESDSLRGVMADAQRRGAASRRWPDRPDDSDEHLLARLDPEEVAREAAQLFRTNTFDALVLSPQARPEGWEDL